jgi:hypothetical protein
MYQDIIARKAILNSRRKYLPIFLIFMSSIAIPWDYCDNGCKNANQYLLLWVVCIGVILYLWRQDNKSQFVPYELK